MFFISYAHRDQAFVRELKRRIKEAGFIPWTDEDIVPGEEWKQVIDNAVKESMGVVVILTKTAVASSYVTYEWAFAMGLDNGKKPIIPVLVENIDAKDIHPKLVDKQWINFTDEENPRWQELLDRLGTISSYGKASDAIKNAERALDSHIPEERASAINTLANSLDPLANDALVRAMQHPTPDVRIRALDALNEKEYAFDNTALPALKVAFKNNSNNSTAIIAILGKIGTVEAVSMIEQTLAAGEYVDSRQHAAHILGEIKSISSVPNLIQALEDKNDKVKIGAIKSLAKLQDEAALPEFASLLKKHLSEQNSELQNALFDAIGSFGAMGAATLDDILEAPSNQNVIGRTIKLLDQIGGETSLHILEKASKRETHVGYRRLMTDAISSIKQRLKDQPKESQ